MLSQSVLEIEMQLKSNLDEEFPIKKTVAYFNNASYTPMSLKAVAAINEALTSYSKSGPSDEYYLKLKEGGNRAREKLALLLNVNKENIVFTESATQSINLVANGFRLSPGDTIITRGGPTEHPSNFLPWKYYTNAKKATILDLKTDEYGVPDLAELERALEKSKAKLVIMSHVLYNLGNILPVKEVAKISHQHDAMFFLDASQAVGSIPIDLKSIDCDFCAGTAAKWICGPLGLAFFYCKSTALEYLDPLNFGPNSCTYTADGSFSALSNAGVLQEGFRNWAYCYGISAAIDLLNSFGIPAIREGNLRISDQIIEGLSGDNRYKLIGQTEKDSRTSIIPLETIGLKPIDIVQKLARQNVIIAEREIGAQKILRVSPHYYNDEREAARMVDAMKSM